MAEKQKGWFSRKHQTNENAQNAKKAYLAEHSPEARRRKAEKRKEARSTLTPQEQLAILDKRLGVRQGARKERERLQALIV